MTVLSFRVGGTHLLREAPTRRQLLLCAAALGTAGIVPSAGAAALSNVDGAPMKARTAAQWARLQRGLDPKTMAACQKAAKQLEPRAVAILVGPNWEAHMFKSIVEELKKAGVHPDHLPPLDPSCAQEELARLRGEAASDHPSSNAVGTSLATANAVVANFPAIGPIVAAVLVAIAAVVFLLGQFVAKAQEDHVAANEKWAKAKARDKERDKEREAYVRLLKLQEALLLRLERVGDCGAFGRKVD